MSNNVSKCTFSKKEISYAFGDDNMGYFVLKGGMKMIRVLLEGKDGTVMLQFFKVFNHLGV